jgi:hypothetical protein
MTSKCNQHSSPEQVTGHNCMFLTNKYVSATSRIFTGKLIFGGHCVLADRFQGISALKSITDYAPISSEFFYQLMHYLLDI